MKRFFGLMPREEIEYEKEFLDCTGHITILIQAGPNGWTIARGDGSADWEDIQDTTENNFEKAYRTANEAVGPLTTRVPKKGEKR